MELRLTFRPPGSLVEFTKLLFEFAGFGVAAAQLRAIFQHDRLPIDFVPAIAGGSARNRDDVPGFQMVVSPTASPQDG